MTHLSLLAAALLIEAGFGYPDALFARIRHPVVWFGAVISACDRRLNRAALGFRARQAAGVLGLLVLLACAVLPGLALARWLTGPWAWGLAVLASTGLASRSLWRHVADVADALARDGLAGGRDAVSRIVGRNPATLDEAGVVRAAIESLAENFSDGVVAPALWCGVAGLPGIAAYKAVNTADSMIGHLTPRHAAFGFAAAKIDDLVNWPAARLAALWLVAAAALLPDASAGDAWRIARRDARGHASPNAGWPEAAMAGALGLRLAGPRVYGATRVVDAWMGDGRAECGPDDIANALALYRTACVIQAVILLLVALALPG